MDLVCVYVVKEHLGFYTDPSIVKMQDDEDLNDTMWRVLTEEWLWDRDRAKTLLEEDKIRYFKLHPLYTEVWYAITNFISTHSTRHLITAREHSEFWVKMCEVCKIENED